MPTSLDSTERPGDAARTTHTAGLSAEYNKSSAGDQVLLAVILSSVEIGEEREGANPSSVRGLRMMAVLTE